MAVRVQLRCTDRVVVLTNNDLGLLSMLVNSTFEAGAMVVFPSGFEVNAIEMGELQEGMRQILDNMKGEANG